MATDQDLYVTDYLPSARSVLFAGQRLRDVLGDDTATLQFAVGQLEDAAGRHQSSRLGYRDFIFSELGSTDDVEVRERIVEDSLASALADLDVANVLLASGHAVGEVGEPAASENLNEALARLSATAGAIERSKGGSGASVARFGFSEPAALPAVGPAADLGSALATFRRLTDETLEGLVAATESVVRGVSKALSELDTQKVLGALTSLGAQVPPLPRMGRLIRLGLNKLEAALDTLIRLLGDDLLAQIKQRIEEFWNRVMEGETVTRTVAWALDVEGARAFVTELLQDSQNFDPAAVERAGDELGQLGLRFADTMKLAERMASAVTLAWAILALTPVAVASLAGAVASSYALILATVIVLGRDYTDTGSLSQRVPGVREIARSIAG